MFLEVIGVGFLVSWLRGGRLKETPGLRYMWTAPLAFALQLLAEQVAHPAQVVFTGISYGLLLGFAGANMQKQSIRLLLAGMLLNLAVILVNGGRIPVDLAVARSIGVNVTELAAGGMGKHAPMTETSLLPILGDIIPIPFPISRVISLGDVFALTGVFLLIQDLMGKQIQLVAAGDEERG